MNKKRFRTWCLVCAVMMMVFTMIFAVAENVQTESGAEAPAAVETEATENTASQEEAAADGVTDGAKAAPAAEESGDPEINVVDGIVSIAKSTGFATGGWQEYAMIAVACLLLYLAIVKQFEPLLLLPIAFGMLLANLPGGGVMDHAKYTFYHLHEFGGDVEKASAAAAQYAVALGKDASDVAMRFCEDCKIMEPALQTANGGLLYYLYQGVKLGIYPPIIFMGVGAMTDFGPLLANPKSLLLGAAAQLGVFLAFFAAKIMGFSANEAASIGIIGGADGPTAIFVTTKLAPHLLGPIAVAAYSYMALVPVIQPPIMKALTTKRERQIRMGQLRPVSKTELIVFPIMVTIVVSLLLPSATPLVGMLMLGNLMRVSGVVERLNKTVQNELCNIVTIFLGLTVGATTKGSDFLTFATIKIVILGVVAFGFGTAGGVLLAKLMNKLSGGNSINPLIGSAGVSAVPMAARVSQKVGQEEDPGNFLLMHAMGPNVAGVIGSAVAAGVFIALFG